MHTNIALRPLVILLASGCASAPAAEPPSRGNAVAGQSASNTSSAAGAPAVVENAGAAPLPPVIRTDPKPPGASATGDGESCRAVTQMAKLERQPADVIFAIDTSGSMVEEIGFVREQMNAFSRQVRDNGVDVRVVVLASGGGADAFGFATEGVCIDPPLGSGVCPDDSKPPEYLHVAESVMQRDILDAYINFYPRYKDTLRQGSLKTLVSISDDDAQRVGLSNDPNVHVEKFLSDMAALDPASQLWTNWRYSAIYPFTGCPESFAIGVAHGELVKRTMGIAGDLCLQDFAPVFNAIANQLVQLSGVSCDWEIPAPPTGETFDPAKTNVEILLDGSSEKLLKAGADCGARDAWHYDDESAPKHVVACPTTCQRIQSATSNAEVRVLFGCETQILPD